MGQATVRARATFPSVAGGAATPAPTASLDAEQGRVPAVDIRAVLFSVVGGRLELAVRRDAAGGRLPRGAPHARRALDAEARRIVRDETGLREQYLEQLYTLGVATEEGWTVVVCYLGLVLAAGAAPAIAGGEWVSIDETAPLSDADRMVVEYALVRLRAKLGYTTIAFHLLPPTFTLRELQNVYQAVLGRSLDKRNFRRRVLAAGFLEETGEQRRDGSHRPAHLYRFRAAHDSEAYLTPTWARGG